jgi:hypothetical protein
MEKDKLLVEFAEDITRSASLIDIRKGYHLINSETIHLL